MGIPPAKRIMILVVMILIPVVLLAIRSAMSQRPNNLGVQDEKLAPCPSSPNCVSSQTESEQHAIEPLPFEPGFKVKEAIVNALSSMPRTVIIEETDDYVYAESTSLIFRFVDDVEVWIDRENNLIHFRSASRTGYSDMGVNRSRIEKLKSSIQSYM